MRVRQPQIDEIRLLMIAAQFLNSFGVAHMTSMTHDTCFDSVINQYEWLVG